MLFYGVGSRYRIRRGDGRPHHRVAIPAAGRRFGGAGLGSVPFVPMMKTADLRNRDDRPDAERRDGTRKRRVFVQRNVGA